jgi:hypothetical protein
MRKLKPAASRELPVLIVPFSLSVIAMRGGLLPILAAVLIAVVTILIGLTLIVLASIIFWLVHFFVGDWF